MVCESLWVGRTQKEWEMGQLCYLGASDEETKPKIGIYAKKNWARPALLKNFHLWSKS